MNDLQKHYQAVQIMGIEPVGIEATHGTQAYLYERDQIPMADRVHKPYDFWRLANAARAGKRGALAYGDSVNMNVTRWALRGEGLDTCDTDRS